MQNHVLDLWNLFDFLMPGYLGAGTSVASQLIAAPGTQRQFNETYGRHIKRDTDSERATLALDALHRQACSPSESLCGGLRCRCFRSCCGA